MEQIPEHIAEYHRLREQAKRHALELRREAIRDAHDWLADAVVRLVRKALRRPGAPLMSPGAAPQCPPRHADPARPAGAPPKMPAPF